MSDIGDLSSLERNQLCRREFSKKVASYFKVNDLERIKLNEDILHSLEHLALVLWKYKDETDCEEFKDAFDTLELAASRLKVDSLTSHVEAVTDAVRHGFSDNDALGGLLDYINMLIG